MPELDKKMLIAPAEFSEIPTLTQVTDLKGAGPYDGVAPKSKPITDYADIAAKIRSNPKKQWRRRKIRKPPKKAWWKFIFRLLFSHLGMFLLVCAYAAFGAWMFIQIELPNENLRREVKDTRALEVNDTINYMADVFWYWQGQNLTHDQWIDDVNEQMMSLVHYVVDSVDEVEYDGNYGTWEYDWTFSKSLLYAVSLSSTIGYGNITPKTQLGMIMTIVYSIIGIPLLLLFLANIGEVMARFFKYSYSRLCCRWCRARRKISEFRNGDDHVVVPRDYMRLAEEKVGAEDYMPTEDVQVPILLNLVIIALYVVIGSVVFSYWESWDMTSAAYFTFITLSTTGLGDLVPGNSFLTYGNSFAASLRMLFTCFYCAFGMALVSMSISLMQQQIKTKIKWVAVEVGLLKTEEELKKEEQQQLLNAA